MRRLLLSQRWWLLPSLAFVAVRVWLVLVPYGRFPYVGGSLVINDVLIYANWAEGLRGGVFPVGDQMWQYPPLAGPVFALGSLLPPDPVGGLILMMAAIDLAIFVMLLRKGRSTGSGAAAWGWVLSGLLIGPVVLTRFDLVPALFSVIALVSMDRPRRAGTAIAVGALLKVWPALLLLAVPRARLRPVVLWSAVSGLAVLGLLTLWSQGSASFLTEQRSRGLQVESVPAWLFLVGQHLGHERTFTYRYGAMEVLSEGIGTVALISTAIGLAGLAWIGWLRLRGRLERFAAADVALVAVLVAMSTSRVLSPQYLIWVAAIGCVSLLDPHTVMRPVLALLIPVAAVGQLIYPMWYQLVLSDRLDGLALQTVRVGLLVAATVLGLWRLSVRPPAPSVDVRVGSLQQIGQSG